MLSDRCTQDIGNGLIKYRQSKCTVQGVSKSISKLFKKMVFVRMIER